MVDWIQTRGNRKLTPRALQVEQVGDIAEIAHSLSLCFRFNRMTSRPYSVAEHCVRGSRLLPAAFAGAFLLHELSEVYLPDVPAPLKPFLLVNTERDCIPWSDLERQHTSVMLAALKLSSLEPLIYSPEVRNMDLAMLAAEKRDLVGPEPEPWNLTVEPPWNQETISPWLSAVAAEAFVARFRELFQ
jgi:hypothetical protein